MKKQISKIIAVLGMLIALCAMTTVSAETYGDFSYTVENGEVTITGYSGGEDIVMPDTIEGMPVTSIERGGIFAGKQLASVKFPIYLKQIGAYTFADSTIETDITLPDGITAISEGAFLNCTVDNIFIPASVANMDDAFQEGCIVNINVSNDNMYYSSENGVLFDKDKKTLIYYPSRKAKSSYIVPDSVLTVESGAFVDCSLDTLMITNASSMKSAFSRCYIENLIIGDGLSVLKGSFYGCSIKSIVLGKNISTIDFGAFSMMGGPSCMEIPDNVKAIKSKAFNIAYSLNEIIIGSGVETIEPQAFYVCEDLERISVSEDNQFYSSDENGILFNKSKSTLIYHPAGIDNDGSYTAPNSVTTIESYAFYDNYRINITIPDTVIQINENVFSPKTTIYGHSGSYAETYALENNITFVAIEKPKIEITEVEMGDYSGKAWDIVIDAFDRAKKYIARFTDNGEERTGEIGFDKVEADGGSVAFAVFLHTLRDNVELNMYAE